MAGKSVKEKEPKTLVLVESPTKAKTIEKYLGKNYIVRASMGHLRDLPKSQFGIDVDNNFEPKYINIRGKGDLIKELKKEAKNATKILLASDPDREGEAIAWHLAFILGLNPEEPIRIEFNEITKNAIKEAVKHPRAIDLDRVDAQQARRMLDRIVGYKLSPLLWRKVRKGLSAGRVQSVTVKLICEREKEIQSFETTEYWTVGLKFKQDGVKGAKQFGAELTYIDAEKLGIGSIGNEAAANAVQSGVETSSWAVSDVKRGQRHRKPAPPFITSSLQQDAARKLGFTSRKTMMIAQQLYEGIELGKRGPVGLITYMRTDSTRIAETAIAEAREYIKETYGDSYVPEKYNIYAAGKKAQDAHEAIRPTSVERVPDAIAKYLSNDQIKLYRLIWQRFVACQMTPAVYDTLSVTIEGQGRAGQKYIAKSSGSILKFPGFGVVYEFTDKKEKDVILPELAAGEKLLLSGAKPIDLVQHFTEPPPRYNDASLVKVLEEKEIGRPSTYAPIIETIIARGYVIRVSKQFQPTELGFVVVDMLEEYFQRIVDEKFTAFMESMLDKIAEGHLDRVKLLAKFYGPFSELLEKADADIGHVELPVEVSDVKCDKCGRLMVVKQGRFGKFLACPGFPECRNTKPIVKEIGIACPKCGGPLVERKTRRSRTFYGCNNYPDCDFVTWDVPQKEKCPACGSLQLKHFYKNGRGILYCMNDECSTRKDHPINKELAKQRQRAEKAEQAEKAAEQEAAETLQQ